MEKKEVDPMNSRPINLCFRWAVFRWYSTLLMFNKSKCRPQFFNCTYADRVPDSVLKFLNWISGSKWNCAHCAHCAHCTLTFWSLRYWVLDNHLLRLVAQGLQEFAKLVIFTKLSQKTDQTSLQRSNWKCYLNPRSDRIQVRDMRMRIWHDDQFSNIASCPVTRVLGSQVASIVNSQTVFYLTLP